MISHNFLDIAYVEPDGQHIKINAIRSLNEFLVKKPQEGRSPGGRGRQSGADDAAGAELPVKAAGGTAGKYGVYPAGQIAGKHTTHRGIQMPGGQNKTTGQRYRCGGDQNGVWHIDASGGTDGFFVGRVCK